MGANVLDDPRMASWLVRRHDSLVKFPPSALAEGEWSPGDARAVVPGGTPYDVGMTARAQTALVVDDDPLVIEAYKMMLSSSDDFTICAVANDGREAVGLYARHRPDITLMDLQMPVMGGVEAIEAICSRDPRAVVVALTTFGTRAHVVAALRAGAAGYLMKNIRSAELVAAMNHATAGEMPLSASVRRMLVDEVVADLPEDNDPADVGLTPRELDVLGGLAEGLNNVDIARRLFVSEGSVKQYLSHIGDKLGVRSRTQILVRAIRLRLVDPESATPADPSSQSRR